MANDHITVKVEIPRLEAIKAIIKIKILKLAVMGRFITKEKAEKSANRFIDELKSTITIAPTVNNDNE